MSHGTAARVLRPLASRQAFGVWVVALAMLLAAGLGLAGLGNQLFWDDEANTAIYARNLLNSGRLTAWDGRNLVGYAYGGALGEDLGQELRVPGLPARVAALGMLLFGETTFGGRVMFVLAGVLSVGLLAVWLRRFLGPRFPWYLPSLILALSPAYLLYIRNCRYYALGVMFTLLVWAFWAPGSSRGGVQQDSWFDRRLLLRYAGGAMAVLLLLCTHYLNAAAALVTLPVFFLDRRYRQPRQYMLLGVICAVTVLYGIWLYLTANPFAADYEPPPDALVDVPFWTHFYTNFGKFLRDLGTHEFFPWCLVPVLGIPWLAAWTRRVRPWARRGWILVAVVLAYVLLAAALTPPDMGKGPTAEMRYVVPLIAVGSAVGGLAVAALWRLARPLAPAAFLILVGTNLLYLGFLADRVDGTRAWWPPTLYRYAAEVLNDYQTGNEAMIDLLEQLPNETTVRIWPPHLVYPPMFYLPRLHYCDQLTQRKRIRADLRETLPDYLFVERSRPEVVLAPLPYLRQKLGELYFREGPDSYELKKVLVPFWNYTSKPEIPARFFSASPADWQRFPGMALLVRKGSPAAGNPALASDPTDANAVYRLGLAFLSAGDIEAATSHLQRALQINPDHAPAHVQLGLLLMEEKENSRAAKHFQAAIRANPEDFGAYVNLGTVLARLGRIEPARQQYQAALRIRPDWAIAHFNLGNLALREPGGFDLAITHYQAALRSDPQYAAAHVNWGNALFLQGKIEESLQHYRAALRINPRMVQAHVQLGVALHRLGDKQAAIAEVREALQNVPPESVLADQIRDKLKEFGGR